MKYKPLLSEIIQIGQSSKNNDATAKIEDFEFFSGKPDGGMREAAPISGV